MPHENTQPTDEQIRTRAYYLWEADGRPANRDWEFWNKAKDQLMSQRTEKPSANGSARKTTPTSTISEPAKKKSNTRSPVFA